VDRTFTQVMTYKVINPGHLIGSIDAMYINTTLYIIYNYVTLATDTRSVPRVMNTFISQ